MKTTDAKRMAEGLRSAYEDVRRLLDAGEPVTATEMARRISRTGEEEEIKSLVRQIQHWTVMGLFMVGLAAPPETHVGRGRARKYPAGAIYWAAILAEMARRGLLVGQMLAAFRALLGTLAQDIAAGRKPWLQRAIEGERVLLLLSDVDANDTDGRAAGAFLLTGRDKLDESMLSGTFINVTATLRNALT